MLRSPRALASFVQVLCCAFAPACGADREPQPMAEASGVGSAAGMGPTAAAGAGGMQVATPVQDGGRGASSAGAAGAGMAATGGAPSVGDSDAGPPPVSDAAAGAAAPQDAGNAPLASVLDRYEPLGEPFVVDGSGADNLSGITWNPDSGTYFGVIDHGGIYELSDDLTTTVRHIDLDGSDYEAISYLGGGEFALARESNAMIIATIAAGTTSIGAGAQELVVAAPPAGVNSGAEAIAYDPAAGAAGRFWVMQEIDPMRVFRFDRPADAADHRHDGDLQVTEPFDPEATLDAGDISDAVFDPRTGHLLILSHEDHRVLEVMPDDGAVVANLVLPESFGGTPSKWEGIALGPDDVLAVASEGSGTGNRAQLYRFVP